MSLFYSPQKRQREVPFNVDESLEVLSSSVEGSEAQHEDGVMWAHFREQERDDEYEIMGRQQAVDGSRGGRSIRWRRGSLTSANHVSQVQRGDPGASGTQHAGDVGMQKQAAIQDVGTQDASQQQGTLAEQAAKAWLKWRQAEAQYADEMRREELERFRMSRQDEDARLPRRATSPCIPPTPKSWSGAGMQAGSSDVGAVAVAAADDETKTDRIGSEDACKSSDRMWDGFLAQASGVWANVRDSPSPLAGNSFVDNSSIHVSDSDAARGF